MQDDSTIQAQLSNWHESPASLLASGCAGFFVLEIEMAARLFEEIEKPKTVGRSSSRTPFKHWILQAELGRLCGIFQNPTARQKVHALACPFHVIDLCAGDGHHKDKGETSSPQIIRRLLNTASLHGVNVRATLIERSVKTFDHLFKSVEPAHFLEFLNIDASTFRVRAAHPQQQVFIHSDPNHIEDWPVTQAMLDSTTETTSMLCTLGCNVVGLKRIGPERRQEWYVHVRRVIDSLPRYHDAILISLLRDDSQWAYLIRLPKKWSNDTMLNIQKTGRKFSGYDLSIDSYRLGRDAFEARQVILFDTREERGVK